MCLDLDSPIKNEGSLRLAQNKVRTGIFSGSLAVFQYPKGSLLRQKRTGTAGGRGGIRTRKSPKGPGFQDRWNNHYPTLPKLIRCVPDRS